MIKVKNLVKNYGDFTALKEISFEANPDKITALLGPNGAGKTTTLRILAGYLSYDSGEIYFFDKKFDGSTDFRKIIGYIPENNPVYDDMEVSDYLKFIAKTYGLNKSSIEKVIEDCSLKDVIGKNIGSLSKGYKQRVSLAKAIMPDPKILLLDEPTTGLDPNQASQTRELIKKLKKDKIIIVSTHILGEVEYLCDDIIIINKGNIAVSGTKDEIIKKFSSNSYTIKVEGKAEINFDDIGNIKNIEYNYSDELNETTIKITFEQDTDLRRKLIEKIEGSGFKLLEISKERITLDEIFSKITGEIKWTPKI